ncbi:uncharacterized protein LOC119376008, partial [Rhipicephalus sanguineus]|uniref:uncharacterized protein LOC119376008 n=1 Tax=Rhipicephalus sanguineus TaxID=34632 RepID=UPI0020C2B3E1
VLVELTLAECGLGGTFALRAARRLLHYSQLRELNVEKNTFSIYSLRNFVEVLQVNKTLKGLVVNMTAEHSEEDVSSLFEMIRQINAFPRLWFQWVYPRASDFPKSTLTGRTPSVCINLDGYGEEEAAGALRAIASNRNLDVASIECCTKAEPAVLQRLADSLASTKSLKKVSFISHAPS